MVLLWVLSFVLYGCECVDGRDEYCIEGEGRSRRRWLVTFV
jgi:hypothetical protein